MDIIALLHNEKGAQFRHERKFRFFLWRTWDNDKPKLLVIGLNPSTANEVDNDNTISSAIGIAKHNGYGCIIMANLYPFVSRDPDKLQLLHATDQIMRDNANYIETISKATQDVLFAWGNFKQAKSGIAAAYILKFSEALCYYQLKDGSPRHLLYCKHQHLLVPFDKTKWSVKPNLL